MTTLKEIEEAIKNLPESELAKLRAWFWEFDALSWDEQIENDSRDGKLDVLKDQALADYQANKAHEL